MCDCTQHFVRIGRANYRCVECLTDITIQLTLMYEIGIKLKPTHELFHFYSFEKDRRYGKGDRLSLQDKYYRVMEIDGTRVLCAVISKGEYDTMPK